MFMMHNFGNDMEIYLNQVIVWYLLIFIYQWDLWRLNNEEFLHWQKQSGINNNAERVIIT